MLALAMLVWLASPMAATPARASGCHVPERPILGTHSSSHSESRLEAWAITDAGPQAPPVLRRVPCPGEVPHVVVAPISGLGPALLASRAIELPCPRESLTAADEVARTEPQASRLDRPPR